MKLQSASSRISLFCLGAMWIFPFFAGNHHQPSISYHGEWLAIMLGLSAVVAWLLNLSRTYFSIPTITLLPLSLASWLLIQFWIMPEDTLPRLVYGFIYLFWMAILIILANNLRDQLGAKQLIWFLAWCLTAGAVIASIAELSFRYILHIGGNWGGIGQANRYGDYLVLGLVSAVYLSSGKREISRSVSIILFWSELLIVVGMSLSTSRSIWVYICALALLTLICKIPEKKRVLIEFASIIILMGVFQYLWKFGWMPSSENEIFSGVRVIQNTNIPIRLQIWLEALQIIPKSLWIGHGFGQTSWIHFQYGHYITGCENCFLEHFHNLFLHLLVETGVVSLAALIGWTVWWIVCLLKSKTISNVEIWWILGILVVIGCHSMVEYPLWFSYFLGIVAVILGIGSEKKIQFRLIPSVQGLLMVFVILALVSGIQHRSNYLLIESGWLAKYRGTPGPHKHKFIEKMQKVIKDSPSLAPYADYTLTIVGRKEKESFEEIAKTGNRAMHFIASPQIVYRQAVYLALSDKSSESIELMSRCLTIYPAYKDVFLQELLNYSPSERKKLRILADMASRPDISQRRPYYSK